MFYRGFVNCKGKKAIEPFKNGGHLIDEAQESYGGVLCDDTILVDVDNGKDALKVFNVVNTLNIKCRIVKTTRGLHFLFKSGGVKLKCLTHTPMVLGVNADYKQGPNAYEILKLDGKNRAILKDEEGIIPKVFLYGGVELANLKEGDGRNDILYKYILTLVKKGYTKDEIKQLYEVINENILEEPLNERELNSILRDEAFENITDEKEKENKNRKLARELIEEKNICTLDNVVFPPILDKLISDAHPELNATACKEVKYFITILAPQGRRPPKNTIIFNNGTYYLDTGEFEEGENHEYISVNKIPHNYNPNATSEVVDKILTKVSCGDNEVRKLILQMFGYCLYRDSSFRKAFILVGQRRNGKSTILRALRKMLGDENCSALDLNELSSRFNSSTLYNKLANIGDDIEGNYIEDLGIFKKLTSGESVRAEQKGKDMFSFSNYAKLIFSANEIPRTKDTTGAVLDRLILIPFNAKFLETDKDYNPLISEQLLKEEAQEYLITLSLGALRNLLATRQFGESYEMTELKKEYEKANNPIEYFLEQEETIEGVDTQQVYDKYRAFCFNSGLIPLSKIAMSMYLTKNKGYKTIVKRTDNKLTRIFTSALF